MTDTTVRDSGQVSVLLHRVLATVRITFSPSERCFSWWRRRRVRGVVRRRRVDGSDASIISGSAEEICLC